MSKKERKTIVRKYRKNVRQKKDKIIVQKQVRRRRKKVVTGQRDFNYFNIGHK